MASGVLATVIHQPSAPAITGPATGAVTTVDATATTTVSATDPQSTASSSNQFDNNHGLRKISTIMPALLIGFVCFLAIFLACGMYHSRRRRRLRQRYSLNGPAVQIIAPPQSKKRKNRVSKPKLWEVDVKAAGWDRDLEALLPVAVELQNELKPSPPPSPAPAPRERSWRRWFFEVLPSTTDEQHPQPSVRPVMQESNKQQAQVAFIVSMPAQHRIPGHSSQDLLLGTAQIPYQHDSDDDVEDPAKAFARKWDEALFLYRE